MKLLFTSLIVLMCSCLTAAAQTTSTKTGTASVTSTIRVRIPDFASVTLRENRIAVDSEDRSQTEEQASRYSEPLDLQANKRWILQTERLFNRKDVSENEPGSTQPPVLYLMYTSTPE